MIHVVGAFITHGNKFLLAQRNKGELKGKWEFPGGKVESSETEFQAIEREIFEELNIKVVAAKRIHSFIHTYPFAVIHLALIGCNLLENVRCMRTNGSHETFKWVTVSDKIDLAPLDSKIFRYLKNNYAF